jgi:hypothetical protein
MKRIILDEKSRLSLDLKLQDYNFEWDLIEEALSLTTKPKIPRLSKNNKSEAKTYAEANDEWALSESGSNKEKASIWKRFKFVPFEADEENKILLTLDDAYEAKYEEGKMLGIRALAEMILRERKIL